MFDDIFNNDWNNQNEEDNNSTNNFKKFYFNWYIDPAKLFKGSMEESRNGNKWFFTGSPKKKPRIENVCVATMNEEEQNWYSTLLNRQNELSRRIASLNRQLERAQHEQAILDIDTGEFNVMIRERYNLNPETYPELIIGNDAKHIYQQVDLSKPSNPSEE